MVFDVRHISKLAMLKIPEEEIDGFKKEMENILAMVEHLPDINTADASLLNTEETMELREDAISPSYPRDEMMQNVPHTVAGCIVVPKTLEE
ncbi:MAG: Asp-tRNA(Asn)/Glu-tRNA(Gln) amidotransferase subunit GatC [Oscillospiraceae bacterium]